MPSAVATPTRELLSSAKVSSFIYKPPGDANVGASVRNGTIVRHRGPVHALSRTKIDSRSGIEFRVIAEHSMLIERNPPVGREIRLDSRPFDDAIMQRKDPAIALRNSRHRARKGEVQTVDDLEQRQVGVGKLRACQVTIAAACLP